MRIMRKASFVLRATILLTLVFSFVATDAQTGPDLAIDNLRIFPTSMTTSRPYDYAKYEYRPTDRIRLSYDLSNAGDEKTTEYVVRIYLSTDTTITSDDLEALSLNGSSSTFWIGWRFEKGDFPLGEYYIGAIVSCPSDSNPVNDVFCMSTPITYGGSDIGIESVDLSNFSTLGSEGEIRIDYCIGNMGNLRPGSTRVYFYASPDTTITSDDHALVNASAGQISAGRTICGYMTAELDSLPRGDYYVGAIIDSKTDIDDLSNNVYCTSERFSLPVAPDLTVRNIKAESGFYLPGDSISIYDVVVANSGYGPAETFTLDYYASSGDTIESSDYHIGSQTGGPLNEGDEDTFSMTCQFPDDMPAYDYYIGVIVTCPEEVYHPENNAGLASGVSIDLGYSRDLVVQSVRITPGTYVPDDTIVIYSLVENIGGRESHRYTVDYYVSRDTAITKNDHHIGSAEHSSLAAGEEDSYETTFRVPFSIPADHYYVGIIVTSWDESDAKNNVGRSAEPIELVHPSGTLCGHIQYKYSPSTNWAYRNNTYPIRCALVQVFEADNNEDPLDDPLVGQTATDPNGNYAIILSDDENRHGNIYIKVLTEGLSGAYPETKSRICILKDDVFDETYANASTVHPHPQNESTVINITALGNEEFMVFDSMVEGFIKAKTLWNVELAEISTYWPSEANISYFDPCEMEIHIAQDDSRDRDVIMHEYGHFVAEAYGVGVGPVGENPLHYWDRDLRLEPERRSNEEGMNLAFREAWASLFSIATQYGDTRHPNSGDSKYDDRDDAADWTWTVDLNTAGGTEFSPGEYFENMNAGALWDIFDDHNDDTVGGETLSDPSLSKIWSISRDYKPDNIIDFWHSWFLDYDHAQDMEYIFESHEMRFVTHGQ